MISFLFFTKEGEIMQDNIISKNNKYINNNKYNNYKNRFHNNRRIYSTEDFKKLYANDF